MTCIVYVRACMSVRLVGKLGRYFDFLRFSSSTLYVSVCVLEFQPKLEMAASPTLNNETVELFKWREFVYEELEREEHGEGRAAVQGLRTGDDVIDDYLLNLPGTSGADTGLDGDGNLIFVDTTTHRDIGGEDRMCHREMMSNSGHNHPPPINAGPPPAQTYPHTYAMHGGMMTTGMNNAPHTYHPGTFDPYACVYVCVLNSSKTKSTPRPRFARNGNKRPRLIVAANYHHIRPRL